MGCPASAGAGTLHIRNFAFLRASCPQHETSADWTALVRLAIRLVIRNCSDRHRMVPQMRRFISSQYLEDRRIAEVDAAGFHQLRITIAKYAGRARDVDRQATGGARAASAAQARPYGIIVY